MQFDPNMAGRELSDLFLVRTARLLKKTTFAAVISPRSKSYYIAAVIIGLSVGLAARDMPVGILLAVVLMIFFSELRGKSGQ